MLVAANLDRDVHLCLRSSRVCECVCVYIFACTYIAVCACGFSCICINIIASYPQYSCPVSLGPGACWLLQHTTAWAAFSSLDSYTAILSGRVNQTVLLFMCCVFHLYLGPKAAIHGAKERLSCWRNKSFHWGGTFWHWLSGQSHGQQHAGMCHHTVSTDYFEMDRASIQNAPIKGLHSCTLLSHYR